MIKHNTIFTHKKQPVVLFLDRVIFSIDNKLEDEFVFATITDSSIQRTLYFCANFENYQRFKTQHKKTKIAGFWHTLFANNKINLSNTPVLDIVIDDVIYSLSYNSNKATITTDFGLITDKNTHNVVSVDATFDEIITLISPVEKIKRKKLIKNIIVASVISIWTIAVIVYFYVLNSQDQKLKENKQLISQLKNNISLVDKQITKAKQNVIKHNPKTKKNLENLFILGTNGIDIVGKTKLNDISLNTNANIKVLKGFIKEYPRFSIQEQIEKPTLITTKEVSNAN
jgi:hypothetical protein